MPTRVVVIGGGITGLTAAYRLIRRDDPPEVVLLEASPRLGGKVSSRVVGGLRLEAGPDSLLTRKPWAVELARELGFLEADLVAAAPTPTHIWTRAGLVRFPSGPFGISTHPIELLRWPGMSLAAKVRAAGDVVLPRRREGSDESLGQLLRRRIGDGATEALVAPLLGGLFAGNVDDLSVQATFPELATWEWTYGSLIRGARAVSAGRAPGPAAVTGGRERPLPLFVGLRGGLEGLTDRLAESLGDRVRLGVKVQALSRAGDGFEIGTAGDVIEADAVLLATPAPATAELLELVAPEAARALGSINHASTAVVLLVYPQSTNQVLPESAGFLAPRGSLPMNAATFVSKKWPNEAFRERAVIRCFVGGMGAQEMLARQDSQILGEVTRCLSDILGLPADPEASAVVRWPGSMPQYGVGHLDLVSEIEQGLPPGITLAGQAYRGAGLPDCVRQGNEAASAIGARLEEAGPGVERVRP